MPDNNHIKLCCGIPLVSTLKFMGAELFCLFCESRYGALSAPETRLETLDLKKQLTQNQAWFDEAAKGLLGEGGKKRDCNQCKSTNQYHTDHATQLEIDDHYESLKKISELKYTE